MMDTKEKLARELHAKMKCQNHFLPSWVNLDILIIKDKWFFGDLMEASDKLLDFGPLPRIGNEYREGYVAQFIWRDNQWKKVEQKTVFMVDGEVIQ